MNFDYIFFDFNGTILDDVDLCLNLLNEMLEEKRLKKIDKERYREIFTFPIVDYYRAAGFDFTKYSFDELALRFIEEYQPASLKCPLYPHLIALLKRWRSEGKHLFVLSASEIHNLKEQLDHFGISGYFDEILATSDIYASGKKQIAADFLCKERIPPERCLFIGDTLHDFQIADSLHCASVLVDFGHQSRERLLSTGSRVIASYEELL